MIFNPHYISRNHPDPTYPPSAHPAPFSTYTSYLSIRRDPPDPLAPALPQPVITFQRIFYESVIAADQKDDFRPPTLERTG